MNGICSITPVMLADLRERVSREMSAERFMHVSAVEQTAAEMARIYCPESENAVLAAALLHDVTKEKTFEEQLEILQRYGADAQLNAPATLHAVTAALVIPDEFGESNCAPIIDAVRYHTTGRADMSLIEKIIYLADYIEPTRKYEGCRRLREAFFSVSLEKMSHSERVEHLDRVILQSLVGTLEHLKEKGGEISPDTQSALEFLAQKLNY